jgi:hypothetical protein
MDPLDALVLRDLRATAGELGNKGILNLATALDVPTFEVETSLEHLKKLGCVDQTKASPNQRYSPAPDGKALLHALYE